MTPISTVTAPTDRSLLALTGLRFFAALMVVLFHLGRPVWLDGGPWVSMAFGHGYVAVSLFFVLSGFILTVQYVGRDRLGARDRPAYFIARVARIMPLYLAVFLLMAVSGQLANYPWHAAAAQLSLTHAWWFWDKAAVSYGNFPSWSLSVEMFFYAVFPFLPFERLKRLSVPQLVGLGVAIYALGMGLIGVMVGLKPAATAPYEIWYRLVHLFPPTHLPTFLAGVLAGLIYLKRPADAPRPGWGWAIAPELCLLGTYLAILAARRLLPGAPTFLQSGLLTPCFALLVFSLAQGRGLLATLLATSPMQLLGGASYGCYLLHIPLWSVLGTLGVTAILATSPELLALLAFVALLIGVSIAGYLGIEQPARAWLQSRWRPGRRTEAEVRPAA